MPVAAIGYTAICAVAGIAMIVFSLYQRQRLADSENWPQSTATITSAQVIRESSQDSSEYHLHLDYEFVVDGQRYTGKRVEFNRRGYLREKNAQAQLARFPVGATVPVYFNPLKPDDAVLLRSAPFNILYLIMGGVMVLFSIAIVAFSLARD